MTAMIEVTIDSVRVSLTNQMRVVILREINAERYLPIWIGPYEAEAITIALQEIEIARPQTHDLLKNILIHLNADLKRVEVVQEKDDVYFANLVIEIDRSVINIDCRPSDALALAVRAHVPIFVARDIMDSSGTEPEKDIQDEGLSQEPSAHGISETGAESSERLSIFEDFLQNLDLDTPDDDQDEQDDSSDEPEEKT